MTSKISFSKLLKEELRHHGVVAGVYIGILTAHMFYTVMVIQNMIVLQLASHVEKSDIVLQIANGCRPGIAFGIVLALLGAFAAVEGFSYLHSKRKMDFYGSLPVSRKRKFATVITAEWILAFAMILADIILRAVAITIFGYGSKAAYLNLLCNGMALIAAYLISFATAALAMMLTGNIAVAVAGMNVLFWYGVLIRFVLMEGYASTFWTTYVESKKTFIDYCLSPATMLYKLYGLYGQYDDAWSFQKNAVWMLPILATTALLLVLSAFLYEKRISERAGNALAFTKLGGLIEAVIIIPAALTAGLVFFVVAGAYPIIWMLVGMIATAIGVYVIMECILNLDIRNLWKRKWYLVGTVLLCIGIAGVFVFDLTGYDDYLPHAKEVRAVLLERTYEDAEYSDQELQSVGRMPQDLKDKVLRLAKLAAGNNTQTSVLDLDVDDSYDISLNYVMENGKIIKRAYSLKTEEEKTLLNEIYTDPEYMKNIMSVCEKRINKMDEGEVYSVFGDDVTLNRNQIQSLMKIYTEECKSMPVSDGQDVVYQYNIIANRKNGSWVETDTYPIYPQYTKTIQQLKAYGVSVVPVEDYEMTEIRIMVYDDTEDEYPTYQVTDRKVIRQYRDQIKIGWTSELYPGDTEIADVTVTLKAKDESSMEVSAQMPQTVYKELMKHAKKWN